MNICTRQSAFIGPKNQKKLESTVIAIIGLGALGSASAHLLTRMGVGKLILCDDDTIEDHNLGRQHIYTVKDIKQSKAVALEEGLKAINPTIQIESHNMRITKENISCCGEATIIIDGTDNHATRRVIDFYAKKQNISWVHGAAIEDKGTVIFFPPSRLYDAIYKNKTKDQHCSISGVLSTTTTAVATLQTHIALLAIIGQPIPDVMYHLNGLSWSEIKVKP